MIEEDGVVLDNGEPIKCYKLDYTDDKEIIDAWTIHIRKHYVSDEEFAESCDELDMASEEYLRLNVNPQKGEDKMSGTARSNGISEILFSDLLDFAHDFEMPHCGINNMSEKTVSEHGTDVIGYKFNNPDKKPGLLQWRIKQD